MECLLGAVENSQVTVETDVTVECLVVDTTAADAPGAAPVVGVVARREGRKITVEARGGVVLCAGGFVLNDEMVAEHAPHLARCMMRLGNDNDRGSGILMAQAAGARVKRMSSAEVAVPVTPPRELVTGILVNEYGQRFINEDTYYGRVGQEALFHQDGHAYLIVDEALAVPSAVGARVTWAAQAVEELEADIGLPAGSLGATLALYNARAADGSDPVFHKAPDFLRPLEPPLGAFDLTVENSIYATFTLGGLDTLPEGHVRALDGRVIDGLFAAGRTTSGVAALGYSSGISLGDSTFFGRLAGESAANRAATGAGTGAV